MIFDTHAHYDDKAFDEDRDVLIGSLLSNGVGNVVNISATVESCYDTLALTEKYDFFYGALGVHPEGLTELDEEKLEKIKALCIDNSVHKGGKIVAVGEIGLDYSYDEPPKDLQIRWFKAQLEMAGEVGLPVVIHSRDAAKDTYDIMAAAHCENIGGIVHCYSYSKEMAKQFLDMGFYIGIGGVLTFKNARKLVEVCEYLPMDRIVLETDCPYLSPMPFRGQRNDSTRLSYVVQKLADIKGIDEREVTDITETNARRVYGICQP
ncbi:MAG: TatD family hydrolase [Lachnospiraceae bacterium]|nr:TatD family hydrolase [Lachnospiraceae bacterium]